ncbi:MAG: UPF0149 family protein [Burkholderiales bacterium]|nr:UPF0149 family protein [Burkholderiales bacterium]
MPIDTALTPEQFDELEAILDDLRTRNEETPQWEFCDGFMAALLCCRNPVTQDEYFDVLLGLEAFDDEAQVFADLAQRERFVALWELRWQDMQRALDAPVEMLHDEAAYCPELTDLRAAVANLSEAERAEMGNVPLPAFAQVWALGFMFAVENWPEQWEPPRDKQIAKLIDTSLQALVTMAEDDHAPPELSPVAEDGPITTSKARLDDLSLAIWAVYDLHEIARTLGPRIEPVLRAYTPGRNDPCFCGSGKKYKKCCGA